METAALKYNPTSNLSNSLRNRILRVRHMIDNMSNEKINVDEANRLLNNLLDSKISEEEFIKELSSIERMLNDSNDYYKLINMIPYLNGVLKHESYSSEDSIGVMKVLQTLASCKLDIRKEHDSAVSEIFRLLFEIGKREYEQDGTFEVIRHIKAIEGGEYYLNNCVLNNYKTLSESNNALVGLDELNTLISERRMLGSDSDLVDKDLIKLFVRCENSEKYKKLYKEQFESLEKDLSELVNSLSLNLHSDDKGKIDYYSTELKNAKNKINAANHGVKLSVISMLLSLALFTGVGYAIPKVATKLSSKTHALTTTEIYIDGEERKEPIINYELINDKEITRKLEITKPSEVDSNYDYQSKVLTYDVTDVKLDSIEEYARLDVDYYGLDYQTSYIYLDEPVTEEIRKCTITKQDFNDTKEVVVEFSKGLIMVVSYTLLFLSSFVPFMPINSLIVLYLYLKDKKTPQQNKDNAIKELEKIFKRFEKSISKEKELAALYNSIKEEASLFTEEELRIKVEKLISDASEKANTLEKRLKVR